MILEPFDLSDVKKAYNTLKEYLLPTPLEPSLHLSDTSQNVFLKLENSHPLAHSFKIRGALNKISNLTQEEKANGIAAISSGNHGIAVCCASKKFGIEAPEIIIPKNTAKPKIKAIEFLGGKAIILGENYDEAHSLGEEYLLTKNKTVIDAYIKDPYIFAGQGTMALELLQQNPDIDTVVVPIGGGGLIGGVAVAIKETNPNIKVIGVQTIACPAMVASIRDNTCYEYYDTEESICSALIGGVGIRGYEICKKYVDDIIVVTEDEIFSSLRFAILKEHQVIEASSAVVIAAQMFYKERIGGKNIALIISGGNIEEELLINAIEKPL